MDVKKTAKSVCKSVTIKKTMQDVIRPTETEEIIPEVKGVPEAKDGKAAWANMDSAKTETITQETVTDKSVPESITGKITEEPAGEPMTEDLLNLEGFKVNSEGVIEGYENLDLILCDGMIIFPADERCSGIGEHALDGIPDAVEVYIPGECTFVAPGVLEKIGGLSILKLHRIIRCMKAGMGCFTTRRRTYKPAEWKMNIIWVKRVCEKHIFFAEKCSRILE